jgi:hypothetical protein
MIERRRNQIPRSEILALGDYERQREGMRQRAICARTIRRVELGPNATLTFENRETVKYQIHEMLRAERIDREPDVVHEIETYSDLLPAADELSATMMFEFPEPHSRDVYLRDLVGFEQHLHLDFDGAGIAPAFFDRRQLDADRISAVQFVRFRLDRDQREALARGTRVRVVADHPRYTYRVAIPARTAQALAKDLADV